MKHIINDLDLQRPGSGYATMSMSSTKNIDFEAVFHQSTTPSVLLTPELTICWCNAAYAEATGKQEEQLIGKHLYDAFPGRCEEQRTLLNESFRHVLETGRSHHIPLLKFDIERKTTERKGDFRDYYWSVLSKPISNAQGEVKFILNQPTDITELTELRGSLSSANKVFNRSDFLNLVHVERKRLSGLFSQAPGFMCTLNGPNFIYEMANEAYYNLIGRRDIIGKSVVEVMPELKEQCFVGVLKEVYESGKAFVGDALPVKIKSAGSRKTEVRYIDFVYQPITAEDGRTAAIFVQGHDVTSAHQLSEEITYQAHHDFLTGLLNRRGLKHARQALDVENHCHRVLYLDLDHFKIVNDRCGHKAGDQLLIEVSKSLTEVLEDNPLLARIGGDEFVLILEGATDEEATTCAKRLLKQIDDLIFFWESRRYFVTISIGIATFGAGNGTFAEALSIADSACFLAKEKGRNRLEFAHPDNDEVRRQLHDMDWANKLQDAMQDDRVVLYGQKIEPLQQSDEVSRIEILSRIIDTDETLIAPGFFIPAAERFGLIEQLDRHIISKVFERIYEESCSLNSEPIHYFINVSGITLSNPEFRYFMMCLVDRYPAVKPELICFEVTETATVANLSQTGQMMEELNSQGFSFALDDFGSGVATFNYLENLPIKYVKIDGEFITGLKTRPIGEAIVKSINEIAGVMGVETIAECIEDIELVGYLKELGVNYGQGYGIHYPEPI